MSRLGNKIFNWIFFEFSHLSIQEFRTLRPFLWRLKYFIWMFLNPMPQVEIFIILAPYAWMLKSVIWLFWALKISKFKNCRQARVCTYLIRCGSPNLWVENFSTAGWFSLGFICFGLNVVHADWNFEFWNFDLKDFKFYIWTYSADIPAFFIWFF